MVPPPLSPGTRLFGRYEIQEVLGRGGFGITYRALDGKVAVAIKELTPPGSERQPDGSLRLAGDARGLVRAFVEEARVLRNFRHPNVLRVREAFLANDTAYCVTEFRAGCQSLEDVLRDRGSLPEAEVVPLLRQLAATLAALHESGYLHRDLKPSNVLVDGAGNVTLIDFGAARSWQADTTRNHTVVFTPGYAPLEQLTENARRGPGTDLYGLCALGYALLTGQDPPNPIERVANEMPLHLPGALSPRLARAVETGLAVHLAARPTSVEDWLSILDGELASTSAWTRLTEMDIACAAARQLRPARRECPQCSTALQEPRPIPLMSCPVCQAGRLKKLDFDESRCPLCPAGRLRELANMAPLVRCPRCSTGKLSAGRALPWQPRPYTCESCAATFSDHKGAVTETDGETKTWAEWGEISGRGERIRACDQCPAEFDLTPRDRWAQMVPTPGRGAFTELFSDEWARVAAGAAPDSGSHRCESCEAEFYIADDMLTVLHSGRDPFGFVTQYRGQPLDVRSVRYLAVGKTSGEKGLVCPECHLELDGEDGEFTVVRAREPGLQDAAHYPHDMVDLHRLARGLPTRAEEEAFLAEAPELLAEALRSGDTPLDARNPDVIWRGPATWEEFSGTLTVTADEFILSRTLKKHRWSRDRFTHKTADETTLTLSNDEESLVLEVDPLAVKYVLEGGTYTCELDAIDLSVMLDIFSKSMEYSATNSVDKLVPEGE